MEIILEKSKKWIELLHRNIVKIVILPKDIFNV
jgi:hypothetical protein